MADELYAPPTAPLEDAVSLQESRSEFYVVAVRKFVLLYVFTWGLYSVYWFYRNWNLYRRFHTVRLWPVPRSIFQIFFVHRLFEFIDARLGRAGKSTGWKARSQATAYVILMVATYMVDRANPGTSMLISLLISAVSFVTMLPLLAAQRAINLAEGDPAGSTNAELSGANIAWMIAGGLLWAAMLAILTLALLRPELAT